MITSSNTNLSFQIHGNVIANNPELIAVAVRLKDCHSELWTNVQDLLNQSSCLVGYLKSAVI